MDNKTGGQISEIKHINQCVDEILKTAKGSRVMRPNYGSDLYLLLDEPAITTTISRIIAETVRSISEWEKRVKINNVEVKFFENRHLVINLSGTYILNDNEFQIEVKV